MTSTKTTYTLPASLIEVTSDEYRVSNYKSLRLGSGWEAYTANIQRKVNGRWVTIGTVEDEGHGGALDVFIGNVCLYEVISSLPVHEVVDGKMSDTPIEGWRLYMSREDAEAQAFVDWALAMPGKPYEGEDWAANLDWTPHAAVSTLLSEAKLAKELNGKRTRLAMLRKGDNPTKQYVNITVRNGASNEVTSVAAWAIKDHPEGRIWTNGAWVPIKDLVKS